MDKTAIFTGEELYECVVILFRICNIAVTFQRLVNLSFPVILMSLSQYT